MRHLSLLLMILGVAGTSSLRGQEASDQSANEAAIRKAAASYVEAFNKHDAKAVAEHWSPEAVYLNRSTGEEVVGRTAIAKQFAALFKEQPELKLEVDGNVDSVRLAERSRRARHSEDAGSECRARRDRILSRQREARWKMVARPCDRQVQRGNRRTLRTTQGAGMDGWEAGPTRPPMPRSSSTATGRKTRTSSRGRSRFRSTARSMSAGCRSSAGIRPRRRSARGRSTPTARSPRRRGSTAATAGSSAIAACCPTAARPRMINVMKQVDENSFTWQTIERTAGDELLPNIDEIQLVRR